MKVVLKENFMDGFCSSSDILKKNWKAQRFGNWAVSLQLPKCSVV
jgi:hypothetical protein